MNQTKTVENHEREGLVIAHFGATADVEDNYGNIFRCHLRKNQDPIITGDRVIWQIENNQSAVVLRHQPRISLLTRPESPKKTKFIAANIDAMIIVSAPPPILSNYLIDRYLIAAKNVRVTPIILLNKQDLLCEKNQDEVLAQLKIYEDIGYRVIFSSIIAPNGLDQLTDVLHNKTCVLVGTSGVGKSSLIAKLIPEEEIKVGDISAAGLGKHTTTSTRLYHLPHGGQIIDSPGIREFSLWSMNKNDILAGFLEFTPFINQCKYRNCQHQSEPGCALLKACSEEKIHPERFASFQKIIKDNSYE